MDCIILFVTKQRQRQTVKKYSIRFDERIYYGELELIPRKLYRIQYKLSVFSSRHFHLYICMHIYIYIFIRKRTMEAVSTSHSIGRSTVRVRVVF